MGFENYTVPETLIVAAIGMGVIFAVMVVLIFLMKGLTAGTFALEKRKAPDTAAQDAPILPAPPAAPAANMVPAKGSQGEVALYDVDDRTAALIMAIVADELKTPLNELRFRSIRERKA